jgi:acyl-CoA thioester hydrolase
MQRREDIAFYHPYRVRWADVDPQGIVFNPNYFVFFDTAWNEYLRAIGLTYPHGFAALRADLVVVHAEATFRDSARFDEEVLTGVRVDAIGRTSLKTTFTVWRGDDLLTQGRMTYVAVGSQDRRPIPVPAEAIHRIRQMERHDPAGLLAAEV